MDKGSEKIRKAGMFGLGSVALVLVGALLAGAGKVALDHTNTVEFCTSCHEMKDNNYSEYKDTIHAHNRSGVKATCADCHVPHEFVDTMVRKIKASNDVFQHLAGTIDTREKFEARRLELAKRVWQRMKDSDSRECRNCHDVQAMAADKQGTTARKQHQKLASGERTCIDCHFGIAHKEPEGGVEPLDLVKQ
ncbi:MAG TPA: NapC/NirT family cytochrome c [Aromatoleum sp.]|uniref:NapC/NirT family cytochrome c n=1 Tax=Aromatoleum sp. TaxID=2307007 RepID=UPI002B486053|nr:NapC/NirT family cytochrome c [Aromatoleum sp.]HJV27551.1 NapC/NirT family cytochrome c [Aromatoleum sp.]